MKSNKKFYITGTVLILLGAAFAVFALSNPQLTFPWSNSVTYTLYALYIIYTASFFIIPAVSKPKMADFGIILILFAGIFFLRLSIADRGTDNSTLNLIIALALINTGNALNIVRLNKKKQSGSKE